MIHCVLIICAFFVVAWKRSARLPQWTFASERNFLRVPNDGPTTFRIQGCSICSALNTVCWRRKRRNGRLPSTRVPAGTRPSRTVFPTGSKGRGYAESGTLRRFMMRTICNELCSACRFRRRESQSSLPCGARVLFRVPASSSSWPPAYRERYYRGYSLLLLTSGLACTPAGHTHRAIYERRSYRRSSRRYWD